jgi:dolichol-phosphate mannosyltransferase
LRTGYGWCLSFAEWNLGAGAGWRVLAGGVVTLAFLMRLVYGAQVELLPEEAYYWNYSQHLDFGYLDHPPMVSWLISLGTAVFGNSEFGVRIGALCCGAISSFYMYRLARDLFGEPSALVAVVLLQALPFFFFAGMLMTPDAPLTAAWVATFYHIERAVIAGRGKAWWGVGVCFGLGLLSKYTIGLLGASTLIFMLLDARASRWLRRPEPYAAALLALALFSPVIFWNAHHDWASFAFQTSRRLADPPRFALPHFMGSILVLLTPTGLVAAGIMLLGRRPDAFTVEGAGDKARAWRLIQVSIVVPLAVFVVFSLRHEVKLDWTGAPWVASLPALAFGVVQSGGRLRQGARAWVRGAWAPTIIVLLLIYGAGLEYLVLGLPGVGYTRHTELVPVGWRDFGDQIHAIAQDAGKASGSEPLIVGMDRYAIASEVAFYSLDRSRSVAGTSSGHLFGAVGLMYETWFPREQQQGRNMLLVAWNREDLAQDRVAASVSRLEPIHTGALMRGDELIRLYYYRMADGYRGITEPH